MADQHVALSWRDDRVPVSRRFNDPYFSLVDGLEETRHVFLAGNDLPARFRDGFAIAELGFGTGLNFLATAQEWDRVGSPGRLHYTSFEAFPMTAEDMARALAGFPELSGPAAALIAAWQDGQRQFDLSGGISVEVVIGDARVSLPQWSGRADAWFLDGFSPAKNPDLWEPELMQAVADHTQPKGTAATYTAAGFVRRGLQAAGFEVARVTGYGRKRHMTRAVKP
jgi:tRNA U34 5-methylaminomethyl-2-thiouridine-forming methyltransferase MnmC